MRSKYDHETTEVNFLEWHPIYKDKLLVACDNKLVILLIKCEKGDIYCSTDKSKYLSGINTVKWDNTGEYLAAISKNGHTISVLDNAFHTIYSQNVLVTKFNDLFWASNSQYFVLSTDSSIYLYNRLNLSFKTWSEFAGKITSIVLSNNSNYILIFTDSPDNPMFLIYNVAEDFYNYKTCDSYNNIPQYLSHLDYKVGHRIFTFFKSENKIITKVQMNLSNDRLAVMYKDCDTAKLELKIFEINFGNSVHEIRINYIFSLSTFREMEISNFELYYNYYSLEDTLLILWENKILSKIILNANNFNKN